MKKFVFVLTLLFVVISGFVSAQTWTVRTEVEQLGEVDYKYTVITKQQYERLLNSHTINEHYATIQYRDILEFSSVTLGRVPKEEKLV